MSEPTYLCEYRYICAFNEENNECQTDPQFCRNYERLDKAELWEKYRINDHGRKTKERRN